MEGTMTNKLLSRKAKRGCGGLLAMGVTPEEYASMSHRNRVRFKETAQGTDDGHLYLEFCTLCTAEKACNQGLCPTTRPANTSHLKIRADLRGQVFGDWRVLTKSSGGNNSDAKWTCLCSWDMWTSVRLVSKN